MPKNIALFCDGTGNRRDALEDGRPATTNVFKLFEASANYTASAWTQTTWYDEGVGTGTSRESRRARMIRWVADRLPNSVVRQSASVYEHGRVILELATGAGIRENIRQGYGQLVHHYRPGDRIYLFGFSRGAYTARCIAGMIARCGLLRPESIRYVDKVFEQYDSPRDRRHPDMQTSKEFDPNLFHPHGSVRIAFLGVWDTVASLGLPLWGWWFRLGNLWSNIALDTNPSSICDRVRHAVSMDERRSQFFVTMFDEALSSISRVK